MKLGKISTIMQIIPIILVCYHQWKHDFNSNVLQLMIDTRLAIDKLENKSSSGHDGISNKLLKVLKFELSKSLTLIINQMITTGVFPDSFKISKIIPLFKKGDSSLLSNYRPISLLPTISKIFERILYNQLYEYFNSINLLAEQQYGFRSNHSTEYAAVKFVDHISKEME